MKPERIWIGVVCALLLAGFGTWIASDDPLPTASIWLWMIGFAIAFLPAVVGLTMVAWNAVAGYFERNRRNGPAP
jgi:uncharacterized membrane protein